MDFPYGETVTRLRAAGIADPYSGEDTEPDWEFPAELDIEGWGVDDSQSAEPLGVARESVVTDYVLYRPEAADVQAGDRVRVRGVVCDVVGRPAFWRHPMTGWEAGFVVRANAVEG